MYYSCAVNIGSPEELHEILLNDSKRAKEDNKELMICSYEQVEFYGETRYSLILKTKDKE